MRTFIKKRKIKKPAYWLTVPNLGPMDNIENKTESKMNVDELRQLVEKAILMIGQANVACLFKIRLNYLAQIMHSAKDTKQTLKENKKCLDGVDQL